MILPKINIRPWETRGEFLKPEFKIETKQEASHNFQLSIFNFQFKPEVFMLCTIIDIRGDYAFVKYDDTGVVSEVAIALLPFGADVGDRLKFENYEFTQV